MPVTGFVGNDDEFVAAKTSEQFSLAQRTAEAARDLSEHLVACQMSLGVVELLETVEVNDARRW